MGPMDIVDSIVTASAAAATASAYLRSRGNKQHNESRLELEKETAYA
jgi:heterodisulfide reductase subunit A-like polyferredoxin